MKISLLGPPELTCGARALRLPRRETRALLYRLATSPHAVPRDELAFLFWSENSDALARRNLTYLIANLRRALPSPHLLLTTDGAIALDWTLTQSDVVVFQQNASNQAAEAQRSAREQAVSLVRGSFLAGFSLPGHPEFEAWAEAERSALERLYLEALAALVQDHAATGDYRSAIAYARRYLATDELAEDMYRRLIALYALNGERTTALREFERCAVVLERELHLDPSPETRGVYQAVLEGRSAEVAALAGLRRIEEEAVRPAGRPTHNLPAPVTSFVGRESEIAYLRQLLSPGTGKTRLLTLTGAGGTGKTRLALEVARGLLHEYADGMWWVDLVPLADPALVPLAVASALGIKEEGDRPIVETLQEKLHSRHLLLLLDNCEHLLDACGELAESLLTACPQLVLFATSREASLGIPGETDYLVPGLSLPAVTAPFSMAQMQSSEAAQLFLARAASVSRNFALTQENAEAVARICMELDGLPLALELAAARLNVFTVQDLASKLDDRFRLLSGGSRRAARRHQTLQAAIGWSYQLLSEAERLLLGRLSVFAGGFTREAAEEVHRSMDAGAYGRNDVTLTLRHSQIPTLDLLSRLLDKSLVVMDSAGEHARYRLLETIRQFAWERLQEVGEADAVQERHARYFASLSGGTRLSTPARYEQLRDESSNLRSALTWVYQAATTRSPAADYGELLLRLMVPFADYCFRYGSLAEGREWIMRVLELPAAALRVPARASVLWHFNHLYLNSDTVRTRSYLEESIAISRELDDWHALALALSSLSSVVSRQDSVASASPLAQEALDLARALGDKQVLLTVLLNVGAAMHSSTANSECRTIFEESLAIARELNDLRGIALALTQLAQRVECCEGEYTSALAHLEEAVALLDRLDHKIWSSAARRGLSMVLLFAGDLRRARAVASEAVRTAREIGQHALLTLSLSLLAIIVYHQGDIQSALRWANEAVTLRRRIAERGDKLIPGYAARAEGRALTCTHPEEARSSLLASLALFHELGTPAESA